MRRTATDSIEAGLRLELARLAKKHCKPFGPKEANNDGSGS
jgi:hypothetical protein